MTWLTAGFPALGARLPACFPALSTGCMFSRAWRGLHGSTAFSDWLFSIFVCYDWLDESALV